VTKDAEGRAACIPIYSRIITLLAEQNDLQYAVPGGLIGVGTTVSPPHIITLLKLLVRMTLLSQSSAVTAC